MGLIKFLFGKAIRDAVKQAFVEAISEIKLEIVEKPEEKQIEIKEPERGFKIKAVLSNQTLTVVFPSGEYIVVYNGSKELLDKVLACTDEESIRDILTPEVRKARQEEERRKKEEEERSTDNNPITKAQEEIVTKHTSSLVESGDFEEVAGNVYLKGIKVAIPQLMLFKFTELAEKIEKWQKENPIKDGGPSSIELDRIAEYEDEYQALKNFWMWCVLCPSTNSRNQLFKFLKNHDLRINKNGFFFAYRRIVTRRGKEEDANLVTFISSEWLRIKVKNKKSPSHYVILKDKAGAYSTVKGKFDEEGKALPLPIPEGFSMIGTLKEQYDKISTLQEQTFTDNHTGSFNIKIGQEVRIDRSKCNDDPRQDCSYGLHVGNKKFGFNGFGDTHILVLINPRDAVSVPLYDANKMRVCAYLPVAVISNDEEQTTFLEDADVIDLADHYFAEQVAGIEKMAQGVSEVTQAVAKVISESLEDQVVKYKEVLSKRVVKI